MKFMLQLMILVILSSCAAQKPPPKPYNNRYGGFDRKEDADCAFLVFQRDAKRELGDKWEEVYEQCKSLSLAGTPLTPEIYNELHRNPSSAKSRSTASSLGSGFATLLGVIAQAHQMEVQRQALEPAPTPHPTSSQPSKTDCYVIGNSMSCKSY